MEHLTATEVIARQKEYYEHQINRYQNHLDSVFAPILRRLIIRVAVPPRGVRIASRRLARIKAKTPLRVNLKE